MWKRAAQPRVLAGYRDLPDCAEPHTPLPPKLLARLALEGLERLGEGVPEQARGLVGIGVGPLGRLRNDFQTVRDVEPSEPMLPVFEREIEFDWEIGLSYVYHISPENWEIGNFIFAKTKINAHHPFLKTFRFSSKQILLN